MHIITITLESEAIVGIRYLPMLSVCHLFILSRGDDNQSYYLEDIQVQGAFIGHSSEDAAHAL